MSLNIARSIAFSGLAATQVQISVTSANISNADTTGYTKKTAGQASSVTGGVGTGVTVTGITSSVDKLLLKSLIAANSDLGAAGTTNSYLTSLQQLYGSSTSATSTSTGTSLANTLASLESALSSLASTPTSSALQSNVVDALDGVTSQLRETSSGIQKLRSNADQDIASAVGSVNDDVQKIADLNAAIKQAAAAGQSTADLEDKRNTALQDLSSQMNVSYYTASNGDLQVYTATGQALVDSTAHPLSYTTTASVSAATNYGSGGFSGIMLNGVDVTSQITSGKIGALVALRDQTLPAAQSQLDELAQQFVVSLNAVSNGQTTLPAPASLTGTATVSSADALSATGSVRLAVTDSSGKLISYSDLDLSSYTSVGDLVNAINGVSGLSASIDSSGHLKIAATASNTGVSIGELTSSVGSAGEGFSDCFGLNDLVTATGASDIAVRSDILSGKSSLSLATLSSAAALTTGSSVLSSDGASAANALYDVLTGSTSFKAVGGLAAVTGSFADIASTIVSSVSGKASQASSTYSAKEAAQSTYANSLSSQSGVNLDEESARLSELQNKYTAASQLIQAINAMFTALVSAVSST
ncbi:flagellar hook-associated protein FlgK [Rhodopseudomonas palustris]|uniref:Flagellar hook-associated protein 1 n=1 Tax=Rhodopseudomonas palustris (strain ATCC BAA-98 / CGA009) TaxID=258594 RepID=Q6NC25_RHOPA|nr:flagellar hook-associated protein FlgK [Rhodopseudomonas palustris]OPF94694.1 flagellar hook-associated protein FlgK [Rhodopseudomonas palustris]PPQ44945.1 flagellar hook-associated protein FlgK [Rhodopseudomonas palustris]QQM02147.1 Flagellar hook-associated protein 1 [Rhodopseudomonas palustris]RJF63602.1 flagellar hook-associated protein FlgK [Rhodopseudomonas palustris]WAB78346.1 flagellar hook-associated protein FlgK [Rhodopseudomonas palustris]